MSNFLADLDPRLQEIAMKANICRPEQMITPPDMKVLLQDCTELDLRKLKEAAAKIVSQATVPVSELLSCTKWSRLSFGCNALDCCTRGGVVTRGITEICGDAAAGKTQLLLQLSLTVQLPRQLGGFGKGVAFICTEDAFPSKRLFQMAKNFAKRHEALHINYLGNIYVEHALESDALLNCVRYRLSKLMASINIGLIVIDSVAAIFRLYTDYLQRARDMRQMTNTLLFYADKFNCAVICVNQMSSVGEGSGEERQEPCLGLAWSHLGRTRIKISKMPKQSQFNEQTLTVRKFEILYSPETPNECAEFLISDTGISDLPQMN